mgnify:CR=1 FL=1
MIFLCAVWNSIFNPVFRTIPVILLNILKCFQVWKVFKGIDPESNIDIVRILILCLTGIFGGLVLEVIFPMIANFIFSVLSVLLFRILWGDSYTTNEKCETIIIFIFPIVFVISSTILHCFSNLDSLKIMLMSVVASATAFILGVIFTLLKDPFVEFVSFFKKQYQICKNKRED